MATGVVFSENSRYNKHAQLEGAGGMAAGAPHLKGLFEGLRHTCSENNPKQSHTLGAASRQSQKPQQICSYLKNLKSLAGQIKSPDTQGGEPQGHGVMETSVRPINSPVPRPAPAPNLVSSLQAPHQWLAPPAAPPSPPDLGVCSSGSFRCPRSCP